MKRVFVAGHRGLVGSALCRALGQRAQDYQILTRTRQELDLKQGEQVREFFSVERPDVVILAAAKVGGIKANRDFPVEFLLENLQIQNSVIQAAFEAGVESFVFLGSSCIYPKFAEQPIREESLLTGVLEPTNEPYAIAKIAGIKLCEAYRHQHGWRAMSLMPTNLYGPNDNYDLENSHVLPALIRKMHEAKIEGKPSVTLWGSGRVRREFLHANDLAEAVLLCLERHHSPEILNVGCGEDVTIRELAELVQSTVGYAGEIRWDTRMPDGTPRKLLDISRITKLGWTPKVSLSKGLSSVYDDFLRHHP
ncbi:MAG: GDP-L-fucose synthase family protein [Verrucomicrobiales bacterium]